MRGYTGRKSAFYELLRAVRKPDVALVTRFEGLPGEFSQHDFGEVEVRFLDGSKKKIEFFASRLKYSRYVCVTITKNHRVESLVRSLARHFEAFGGLPSRCVFDRPTSVVLHPLPRIHLTRYLGVLASRSKHRASLPNKPEPGPPSGAAERKEKKGAGTSSRRRKLWAELMKRSFAIDVLQCPGCQGRLVLIAVVCDPGTIRTTLLALGLSPRPPPLAPPRSCQELFD